MKNIWEKIILLLPGSGGLVLGIWAVQNSTGLLPFSQSTLARQEQKIRTNREEVRRLEEANREMTAELAKLRDIRTTAANLPPAAAAGEFRSRLERAAAESGLKIRSLGDIRENKIEESIVVYELTFAAEGSMAELDSLLRQLHESTPRLYWKNLTLRVNTASLGVLQVNGTASMLNFQGEQESDE